MPRGDTYSADFQAAVVAAVLSGLSVTATANQFRVSKSSVVAWRDEYLAANREQIERARQNKQAEQAEQNAQNEQNAVAFTTLDMGLLVADYLTAALRALAIQARAVSDEAWIRAQPAEAIAQLHNALADRAIQVLAASQPVVVADLE